MKLLDSAGVSTLWGKVKDHVKTSIDSQQFKTINGTSVKGAGDIHIDLTLYKVVSALPTSDIDTTKIYLVKDSSVDGNLYSEYMYVDEKWEKLGNFRSSVDLEPYAKTDYVNTKLSTKVDKESGKGLSTNDFTTAEKNKLANISAGANNYSLPLATSNVRGGAKIGYTTNSSNRNYAVQLSNEQMYVNVPWTDTNTTYDLSPYAKKTEAVKNVDFRGVESDGSQTSSTASRNLVYTLGDGSEKVVDVPLAEPRTTGGRPYPGQNGFMRSSDKAKLDGIEDGANNYTLPTASASVLGGVLIGYGTSGRNYAVLLDESGKAYVNVPWTDTNTTYGLATSTNNGLMKASDKAKLDSITTITDTELKTILV